MHWKTLAYALLASTIPTANAVVKMGCWNHRGNKFNHHCATAYTSMLQALSRADHQDWIDVPSRRVGTNFEACQADISSDGRTVAARTLLVVYNQLAARCQDGWFYFDNGWMGGGVHGKGGFKVNSNNSTSGFDIGSTENSVDQWELPDDIESFPLPEASPEASVNGSQPTDDLAARALTFGQLVRTEHFRNRVLRMYRGTGFSAAGQHPFQFSIVDASVFVIANMFNRAATGFYGGILRDGLARPDGSTTDVVAMVAQLNNGVYPNWISLYNTVSGGVNDGVNNFGLMMSYALSDVKNHGFTSGVYHIYDQFDNLIVSMIINGITGTVAPFPAP